MTVKFTENMRTIAEARGEPLFLKSEIDKAIASGYLINTMIDRHRRGKAERMEGYFVMADVKEGYEKANEAISQAKEAYDKTLTTFRASIKNDLASIAASADRVQKEAAKSMAAYRQVIELMTSDQMITALANAERLASALESIGALQSHKITFAVLDSKPNGGAQ